MGQFPPSLWYFDIKHSKTLPFRATAFGLGKSFDVLGLGAIAPIWDQGDRIPTPMVQLWTLPHPLPPEGRDIGSQLPLSYSLPNTAAMNKILPWGHCFPTDEEGFILNDCHWDKILPPWMALVEELRHTCLGVWDSRLQGLYLRGSVPRGLAILNSSDLDSFAILAGELTSEDINQAQKISQTLKRRYLFCKKVELILFDETFPQPNHSIWPVILQTQSLKIAGHHHRLSGNKTKPGLDLMSYSYTWNTDLRKTLDILNRLSPQSCRFSTQVKKQCAWITRRMIRVGLELVLEQEGCYTPDLYHCYERFSTYFPEHRTAMKKALELAIKPSQNRPGLIIFLREFGGWLAAQVNQKFYSSVGGEVSTNKSP